MATKKKKTGYSGVCPNCYYCFVGAMPDRCPECNFSLQKKPLKTKKGRTKNSKKKKNGGGKRNGKKKK